MRSRLNNRLGSSLLVAALFVAASAAQSAPHRAVTVDAGQSIGKIRSLRGIAGYPGPGVLAKTQDLPDFTALWREAGVDFVRSYDWRARLDTSDSSESLFPHWAADPEDPASYNFAAADAWVSAVRAIGADVLFTFATEVPRNAKPPADIAKWERVVRHVVEHYTNGWANGMQHAIRYWEFSDQPDFYKTHFDGTPDQFYAMYAGVARSVKSVDPILKVGGPNLAFPLNDPSPYREGFLDFVKQNQLPLDFVSWIWFTDTNHDPYDYVRVADVLKKVMMEHGFADTPQVLATFNVTGIPTATLNPPEAAAYQVAALTYLQDAPVDRVVLFRGDNGFDPNYQIYDPDHMVDRDGTADARGRAFILQGQMRKTPIRLAATGGDTHGYTVLAGRSVRGDVVQVLIANYAIPAEYLVPGKRSLEFTIPVGPDRAKISVNLLDRRVDAAPGPNAGFDLTVRNLPWGRKPFTITRYSVSEMHRGEVVSTERGKGGTARLSADSPMPAVELVELRQIE